MIRNLSALLAGLVFGFGLTLSQMVNPAKVLSFLDIFGNWDPSLAFVMGGATLVTFFGYRLVTRNERPLFAERFHIPTSQAIDRRLVTGSLMFGAGWGLVGLCPGPAISALAIGGLPVFVFFVSMGAGILLFQLFDNRVLPPTAPPTEPPAEPPGTLPSTPSA